MPDSHAKLSRGLPFFGRIDQLSDTERSLYDGMETVTEADFPIMIDGEWRGLVGFSDRRPDREWTVDDERLLAAAADLFARVWERQDREEELERAVAMTQKLYDYERGLAACSQALLAGSGEAALELALRVLLDVTRADFGAIERNVEHHQLGLCSQVICRAEVPSGGGALIHDFDEYWLVPWSQMPDSYEPLAKGVPHAFLVADLGPIEAELYEQLPTRAEVDIPITVDGAWRGLIALGWAEDGIHWDSQVMAFLQTAADMVGAFWVHQDGQARLEELVRSKDEFLAAISHELRTPLTVIVGLSAELRDRAEEFSAERRDEFNTLIADEGIEMAQLVEDLLVGARSEVGSVEVEAVPLDVAEVVARVVSAQPEPHAITTVIRECVALADPMRVRQVLRNLLSNAVRYGGPSVTITCTSEGGRVVVAVTDDGAAISGKDRDRIFEAYQRAHDEPSQPASVGLGLTVSRNLARLMGGDVLYQRVGNHNVFELTLPAAQET